MCIAVCTRLSTIATEKYEGVRAKIARFLNGAVRGQHHPEFRHYRGALIWCPMAGPPRACRPGDEIILSIMEHHANIVPWHFLRERLGCCDQMG